MRNHLLPRLARQPNQPRNSRGFFEHGLFRKDDAAPKLSPWSLVCTTIVFSSASSFQTAKDRADTLIDQRDQAEVTLLDATVFIRCNSEEQLDSAAAPDPTALQACLPFAHQTVPQRNVFRVREA